MGEQCYICGSDDATVRYCGLCKKFLCQRCRNDPVARAKAVAHDTADRLSQIFHN